MICLYDRVYILTTKRIVNHLSFSINQSLQNILTENVKTVIKQHDKA